jgi:single-strand DNA-binding protein
MQLTNVWTIIGNIGANQKDTNSPVRSAFMQDGTPVHNFSIAINMNRGKDASGQKKVETKWVEVSAWGSRERDQWEGVLPYLQKGKTVVIRGEAGARVWVDKNGEQRISMTLRADSIQLVGGSDSADPFAETEDKKDPDEPNF